MIENNEATELTPLQARQAEVAQYEANIEMYKAIKAGLPDTFPAHLEKYKGTSKDSQHQVITEIEDLEDIILVSDLWTQEACTASIKTETLEMRKALAILNAMPTN